MSQLNPDTTIAVLRTAIEAAIFALESGAPMPLNISRVMFYYRADGQLCATRVWVGRNLIVICPGPSNVRDIEATDDDLLRSFHHLWRMGARWADEFMPRGQTWERNGETVQMDEPQQALRNYKMPCPTCGLECNTIASREMHWQFNPECRPTELRWDSRLNERGETIYTPRYVARGKEAVAA